MNTTNKETTMNRQQILAIIEISRAIVEAVKAAGELGAPAGTLYAALMAAGCTLTQFEGIMGGMTRGGILTKSGHIYRVGPAVWKFGKTSI
jgi:hypothetical protein